MTEPNNQEELSEDFSRLQGLVLKGLVERLTSKDANSTDYSNAIKFLRDNNVTKEEEPRKPQGYTEDLDLPFKKITTISNDLSQPFKGENNTDEK